VRKEVVSCNAEVPTMIEILLMTIVLSLLWIGWELHRVVNTAKEFLEGFVEGYQESMAQRSSLTPAPEHRIANPDMSGWKSAQKS
jgi:hypothetical protein